MEEVCEFLSSGADNCDPECLTSCITSILDTCGEAKTFICTDCDMDGCNLSCFPLSSESTCNPFSSSCCSYLEADCLNSIKCDQATENLSLVIQSTGQVLGTLCSNFFESFIWLMPNDCLISLGVNPNPINPPIVHNSLVIDEISIQPAPTK